MSPDTKRIVLDASGQLVSLTEKVMDGRDALKLADTLDQIAGSLRRAARQAKARSDAEEAEAIGEPLRMKDAARPHDQRG